jgi:hypothetical protein
MDGPGICLKQEPEYGKTAQFQTGGGSVKRIYTHLSPAAPARLHF